MASALVAVPFLSEAPELVARTLKEAEAHPAVGQVVGIHGANEQINSAVRDLIGDAKGVNLIPQRRFGMLRPGKGDAINTGFRFFLDETSHRRLHFYDADIKTFHRGWIEKAERALDRGYDAVRHFYPRSPTDGMITWMITRPAFALLWPLSVLPWIEQPMSGEVAFQRSAVATLAADPAIVSQSDWGIDTALTHRTVAQGLSIYECFAPEGKDHQLYGSLRDLRTMLLECLNTLQSLRSTSPPVTVSHTTDPSSDEAPEVTTKVAYDIEATMALAFETWSPEQLRILQHDFGLEPDETRLDTTEWLTVLRVLLDHFDLASLDWQEIAFRLWTRRVLTYSSAIADASYDEAMSHLGVMISQAVSI